MSTPTEDPHISQDGDYTEVNVLLGITKSVRDADGNRSVSEVVAEIDVEDHEFLDALWMCVDEQSILNLPLAIVPYEVTKE